MRKFVGLLLVVAGIEFIGGCRADVTVSPPPSLAGKYKGTYSVQEGSGQSAQVQDIVWTFKSTSYSYALDTNVVPRPIRVFCDAYGGYELTSGVDLSQDPSWQSHEVCNGDKNPTGLFNILINTGTELILKQIVADITKEIHLKKQTQ